MFLYMCGPSHALKEEYLDGLVLNAVFECWDVLNVMNRI